MKYLVYLSIAALLLTFSGCRQYHYFMDMAFQPSVDSQEVDGIGGRKGNLLPPANTVGHGEEPYPYSQGDDARVANLISSPFGKNAAEIKTRGRDRFNIYCAPCHGEGGKGDGPIKARYSAIRPLVGPAKDVPPVTWPVERIYHVITVGIRTMQPYSSQLNERDRWLVAHYVKYLQGNNR